MTPVRCPALSLALVLALLAARAAPAADTVRVSISSEGVQANGNNVAGALSGNGRFAVFSSAASTLVPGDTNNRVDVFVRDLKKKTTRRVSVGTGGVQAGQDSSEAAISANGRFVVFTSTATELDSGIGNGVSDVFVHDLKTGQTSRVSLPAGGGESNGQSFAGAISASGRFVAFTSEASNLVDNDTNGTFDVFVRDRKAGITRRVSIASNGAEANSLSSAAKLSASGRHVLFRSSASNLVDGDTNGVFDAFTHDRKTGLTQRVSVSSAGEEANQGVGSSVALSANGRYAVFTSAADNLVPGDRNVAFDVFVRDRFKGVTRRVSVASDGSEGNGDCFQAVISGNGRCAAFWSVATNLVTGDTNAVADVFVHDLKTRQTTRASVSATGEQASSSSGEPGLSASGRFAIFRSNATNLVEGDSNGFADIFVRDRK